MAATSRARAIVEFMRGALALMPDGAMRLLGGAPSMRHGGVAETVFLLNIPDRLSVVAAMPLGEAGAAPSPLVLTVRTIDQDVLANIGDRLQLANLRMIDDGAGSGRRQRLSISPTARTSRSRASPGGRSRPGAEILNSRHPLHRHRAGGLRAARRPGAALHAPHRGRPSPPAKTGCAISRCTTRCAACRTATSSASGSRR